MCFTIFSWLIRFSSSSFVFCLHSPFVFCVGPKILLSNLLSNTNNFCLMFSVNTQHLDPYTAAGLITVWYSLSSVFLVISFFWSDIYHVTLFFCWTYRRRKRKVSIKKDAHLIGVSTYRLIGWMKRKRRWSWRRLSYWMIVSLVARVSSCDRCTATAQIQIQRLSSQAQRLAVRYLY